MGEGAEQEGDMTDSQEVEPSGLNGHDAAMDSFVASLLQRTSLDGDSGARLNGPGTHPMTLGCARDVGNMIVALHLTGAECGFCMGAGGGAEREGQEVSEEAAAALRAQMEELLRPGDQARSSNEADAQYGRDMWARCEALTAGAQALTTSP